MYITTDELTLTPKVHFGKNYTVTQLKNSDSCTANGRHKLKITVEKTNTIFSLKEFIFGFSIIICNPAIIALVYKNI